jgi:hypothetical protein
MSVSLAGNYWFNSVVMSSVPAPAGATGAASPLSDPNAIGSVTMNGTAVSHFDVADLLRDLAKEKGLSHPVANNSAEGALVNGHKLVTFGVVVPVDSTQQPTAAVAPSSAAGAGSTTSPTGPVTNSTTTPTKAAGN